jgi:CheY-like chemotaxis protein
MDDYLSKPVEIEALQLAIERWAGVEVAIQPVQRR